MQDSDDFKYCSVCGKHRSLCYGHAQESHIINDKQQELADMVNHPAHYTDTGAKCKCGKPIEVIQITQELNFCLGNVVKYVLRAGKKGDRLEDLRKARRYIDFEIERLTGE